MDERDHDASARRTLRPDRAERLAAALRANLKRRKAQARGRADPAEVPGEGAPHANRIDSDEADT
ncbi:MAG: hypothetical protein GEU91_23665 [Rhizobiales bacterium]|nr:hypothetical protein [Hyphomicrobiales bacterium]